MRSSRVGARLEQHWRWFILLSLGISYLLVFTQRTGPGVVADQLQAEFHVSAAVLGTITSIQYLLYMLMQIPVGLYADRSGPERMLVMGVLLDGVGTIAFASAHSFTVILIGRAIVGLGDSLIWVNIVLILAKWFARGRFAAVLALVNTAGNIGALITSIPLAAWIAVEGWHMPFLIIGGLLLVAGLIDVFFLLVGVPKRVPGDESQAQIHVEHIPVLQMLGKVVRDRTAWATFCCHFGAMGTYLAMVSLWVIPYFMAVYRLPRAEAAWFTLTAFIGALVASPIMGALSDRLGDRKRPYLVVQLLAALSWLLVVVWNGQPPVFVAGVIMFVVGFACGSSLLTFAAIRDFVPASRAGVTSGFANTGGFLSAVLLPVLFGVIIDVAGGGTGSSDVVARHAYRVAFILPTVFAFVGVLGSLMLPKGKANHTLVFVYGTLRQGESNHHFLSKSRLVSAKARAHGLLYDTGNGYPAMVPGTPAWTTGEVYEVDEPTLIQLDKLEDYYGPLHPENEYDRVSQAVETDSATVTALVYVYPPERVRELKEVRSGDWMQRES